MEDFFRKIKLIDAFKMELEISKSDFVNVLKSKVEPSDLGLFSDTSDVFSSSKNEYKGHVDYSGFTLKRKRRFFDMKMSTAKVIGTYRERGDKLLIDSKINGFDKRMYVFYGFALVFYTIFLIAFIVGASFDNGLGLLPIPFILFHAALMFGIPYFIMKRSVSQMKYDLEREFHFMTKSI